MFNSFDQTLDIISSDGPLTDEAIAAVSKAPIWLQPDLENTFSQLTEGCQQIWAMVINNALDPYVDEIAFSIAHSSPQFLSSEFSFPELFEENAELIYNIDADLDYVEVVDYGNSVTDEDLPGS